MRITELSLGGRPEEVTGQDFTERGQVTRKERPRQKEPRRREPRDRKCAGHCWNLHSAFEQTGQGRPGPRCRRLRSEVHGWLGERAAGWTSRPPHPAAGSSERPAQPHTRHLCVLKKIQNHLMLLEWEAQSRAGTERSQVRSIRWDHLLEQGQQTGFSWEVSAVHLDHPPRAERFTRKVPQEELRLIIDACCGHGRVGD